MASRGVNKAILIGNVGISPNIIKTSKGETIANFSLATTSTWKDEKGDIHQRTEWHTITAFKGIAKIISEYVKKGDKLYICGEIRYRKYTTKEGIEKNVTEITALEINLLENKNREEKESNGNYKPPQSDLDNNSNYDYVPF